MIEIPDANLHPERYEWVNFDVGEVRPASESVPLDGMWQLRARPGGVGIMVERVARAIAGNKRGLPPSDPAVDLVWHSYCGQARAAIEALRDPTPAMLNAAAAAMSPGKRPTHKRVSVKAKHGIRYRSMIDTALLTPSSPPLRRE